MSNYSNYFTLKKTTKDDILISADISSFREAIAEYLNIKDKDDEIAFTEKLKPIILDSERFLSFCDAIQYSPVIAIELMVAGRFDVLSEHRIVPKLKTLIKEYCISSDGSLYQ